MTDSILIINSSEELEQKARAAVSPAGVAVAVVSDIPSAKRRLLVDIPTAILCQVETGADRFAGIRFVEELKLHPRLGSIPVILFSLEPDEHVIAEASRAGASGLLSYPVDSSLLRQRLQPLLPALKEHQPPPAEHLGQPAGVEGSGEGRDPDRETKLKLAQHLLAKALHNLKSSSLLDATQLEEVPQIVAEITRAVCGAAQHPDVQVKMAPVDKGKERSEDRETRVELDTAFKKNR